MKKLFLIGILFCSNAFAFSIDITSEKPTDRALDSFVAQYGYSANIKNADGVIVDNPETKDQFAKKILRSFVKESAKAYEANIEAEKARKLAIEKCDSEITIN